MKVSLTFYIKLEVQSKHDESENTNSVLSFYFEYSADGASWEYHTANGANKVTISTCVTLNCHKASAIRTGIDKKTTTRIIKEITFTFVRCE